MSENGFRLPLSNSTIQFRFRLEIPFFSKIDKKKKNQNRQFKLKVGN